MTVCRLALSLGRDGKRFTARLTLECDRNGHQYFTTWLCPALSTLFVPISIRSSNFHVQVGSHGSRIRTPYTFFFRNIFPRWSGLAESTNGLFRASPGKGNQRTWRKTLPRCNWWDSNLWPLTPQSSALTTRPHSHTYFGDPYEVRWVVDNYYKCIKH